MLLRLLSPEYLSVGNTLRHLDPGERLKYYLFGGGGLIFWGCLFLFFHHVLGIFLEVEIFGAYLVKKLMSILLLALFSMLCFSNLISALSSFYLSEALPLLHSLPISTRQLHQARFVHTFVTSSWMMAVFGLPVFLAYGLVYHAGITYYLALFGFLIPYLMIPTGIGVILATLLVNVFPARRTKELMVVVSALFIVGLFVLLRLLQPERLVNAGSFSDILVFLGQLQTPTASFLPSHWGVEILMPLLTGDVGEPWYYLGLTMLTGAVALVVSQWSSLLLYSSGWTKAQQASTSVDRKPGVFDRLLHAMTGWMNPSMQAMVIKDVKTFVRDAAEWPQLLLILALIAVYLYSVKVLPLEGPFITLRIHNLISFLNLAMVAFVVSSVAVRFLFTSVSVEGRVYWLLRAAPLEPMQFLLAKYMVGLPLLIVLGLFLVVVSNLILGVRPLLMVMGVVTMLGLCGSLAGLSVGIGAMYPNFKAENLAKIAAGPGGILFMIVAQIFVAAVLAIEAFPVFLIVRAEYHRRPLFQWEWVVIIALLLVAVAFNVAAAIMPMRRGARTLRALS